MRKAEIFGEIKSGAPVHRLALRGGGLRLSLLTLGAIVQDLRHDALPFPLVLGAETLAPYLGPMQYFGAIVGRFANRIARGQFTLDGASFQTALNFRDRHTLHGGPEGSSAQIWQVDAHEPDRARLSLEMADGAMGFPGHLRVTCDIALPGDGVLAFDLHATADRATPCSFAHHGFFTLDDAGDLAHHRLHVAAEHVLAVDDDLIPTGALAPVAGTGLDFRQARGVINAPIDHNFCLATAPWTPLRPVARLESRLSGASMELATTQPGLQVYNAAYIPPEGYPGLGGRRYGAFAGLALEAQAWPDAPNHAQFPDAILRPGAAWEHRSTYRITPR